MRRTLFWLKFLMLTVLLAAQAPAEGPVRPGSAAPPFELEHALGGRVVLSELLTQGPVVIWFADVRGGDPNLRQLGQAAQEAGTRLVLIPVLGPDRETAVGLAQAETQVTVLLDPDGRVTLLYTGEFVVGVAPRENLYVINRQGTVRAVRFYPGIPPRVLSGLLQQG
ncbi:MAG: redoxin domain-containing protein [Armatimonadetes bacterium]|nr:redoxin domain-containing protein [Armatimonadota bacterium]